MLALGEGAAQRRFDVGYECLQEDNALRRERKVLGSDGLQPCSCGHFSLQLSADADIISAMWLNVWIHATC
jgi:hypothetical protein